MTRLTRRALALGLAALPLPALAARPAIAPLTADDRLLVDKAAAYLQGLTEAKGRFVQTDARGVSAPARPVSPMRPPRACWWWPTAPMCRWPTRA